MRETPYGQKEAPLLKGGRWWFALLCIGLSACTRGEPVGLPAGTVFCSGPKHLSETALDQGKLRRVLQPPPIPGAQWLSPAENGPAPYGAFPVAGITSHHLLVSWYIDRFFADLKGLRKKPAPPIHTFIVVSPKHFVQGKEPIALSKFLWETGLGRVRVNFSLAEGIRTSLGIPWDPDSFAGEHGIGIPVAFMTKHFPRARLVPIVLTTPSFRMANLATLAEAIGREMARDPGIFLLISSDFSHQGNLELTQQRDAQSREALTYLTPVRALKVCCDNNAGMILLSLVLEQLQLGKSVIAAHTSGYEMVGITEDITSYFFCYFY
ncbi:MAG: AmmeMemoRadiSam system protein B [Treponemataceae bacterium]|nr:AmmeMemoRadiSam system protein B [Treponemataceae bacterium]